MKRGTIPDSVVGGNSITAGDSTNGDMITSAGNLGLKANTGHR